MPLLVGEIVFDESMNGMILLAKLTELELLLSSGILN